MTTTGTNTLASYAYRAKFKSATLQQILRRNLIAEAICDADRTDSYLIKNPYGSQPVAQITAITGTYTIDDYTITTDSLTVNNEIKVANQVYDFEQVLLNYDMFVNRVNEEAYCFAAAVDQLVLNGMGYSCTGAYTTPVGGFTTASNVLTIIANLQSKVAGYESQYKDTFLVVENTDLPGIQIAQATNGFAYADQALTNGLVKNIMGTDIYVTRTGTFTNSAIGAVLTSPQMSGCRLFGVKNVVTYAEPRGVQFEEKSVSGKTGKEVVTWGYVGYAVWATKAALIVKITLA